MIIIKHDYLTKDDIIVDITVMKIGDTAILQEVNTITRDAYVGHLIIKTYNGFVSLTDPQVTWERNFGERKNVVKVIMVDAHIHLYNIREIKKN